MYSQNFTEPNKKFVLSLHYNVDNSYLIVNGKQELKFKAKNEQMLTEKLCAGNLSTDWTAEESQKTGLYRRIYDFIVDYQQFSSIGQVYDMHRFLMTKHGVK